ncbi:MAG: laminin B domain-containing protein [Phycisphaerales bacterium JB037]
MMKRSLCVMSLCAAGAVGVANAQVSYTFDSTDEGWTSINDTSSFGWDGTLGNPPGAIRGVDRTSGAIWFFSAPAADLGDLSGLYGQSIDYDILGITGAQDDLEDLADVILDGPAGRIGIDIDVVPVVGQWTSWSATVSAGLGWKVVTSNDGDLGADADEQLIRDVLASVDSMYIRGEYTSGSDSAALDNVSFAPAPGTAALLALGGIAGVRRRR